jgi:hypothetical protein
MTDTSSSPNVGTRATAGPRARSQSRTDPSGWVGWIAFAAVMMVVIGALHAIEGFIALFKNSYYSVRSSGLVISVDYTAWGWIHLIAGVLVAAAGIALFSGRMWARVVGVAVVLLSLLANFTFASAYPVWSTIMIVIDVFVLYALIVHGREMRDV